MKILMLGWELPPHNSGGLGTACYHLCKELSKNEIDIEFLLPYTAKHDINFMNVTAVNPQGALIITRSGNAYDSFKYFMADGSEKLLSIYEQQQLYEESVAEIVNSREFDIVH